jgi:hypothetical protein
VSGAAPGIDRVAIGVLVSFLVAEAVLIFLPALPFQRRFSEGLIIPLAALAAAGVSRWPGVQIPLAAVVIALAALSTTRFAHDGTYLPQARWRAFGALTEEDVVLAGGLLSPRIPAFSSATVYAARPVETVHFPAKLKFREVFRRNPTSPDVWRELRSSGVNLVITDSADGTFDVPDSLLPTDCFQPAFRFGPLSAYRLRPGCPVP